MTIYIYGAGPIALQISQNLQDLTDKVFLISSKKSTLSEGIQYFRSLSYGNLESTESISENDVCIITTRIDLIGPRNKNLMFNDLHFLSKSQVRFMNLSSVAVYGSSPNLRSEEMEPKPNSQYGEEKLKIERELNTFIPQNQITHLRVANLFGLTSFNDLTNNTAIKVRDNEIIHSPTVNCFRDFVPFDDFSTFVRDWVNDSVGCSGLLNFATGNSISVADWIGEIGLHFNCAPNVVSDLTESLPLSFLSNLKLNEVWGKNFKDQKQHLNRYLRRFRAS